MNRQLNTAPKCPHCEFPVRIPPDQWRWSNPWQCGNCGGMYGIRMHRQEVFAIPGGFEPLWPLFTWMEARRFGFFASGKYYVYAICYPNGIPLYVGRGQKLRLCQHVEDAWRISEERLQAKHREIIALARSNESEWYHFLALVDDPARAAAIERSYAQKWGIAKDGGLLLNRVAPDGSPDWEPDDLEPVESVIVPLEVTSGAQEDKLVFHPGILEGNSGQTRRYTCGICRLFCLVPENLISHIVQCPNCAHLFIPVSDGWSPAQPRIFG